MCRYRMKKMSRGAFEDMKGFVRVAETLLEITILTLAYYVVWMNGYNLEYFAYKGKYVLMGVYAVLLYALFLNSDCTMFGQLHRVDLMIGQVISIFLVNIITYLQLCLIANGVLPIGPMMALTGADIVIAILLIFLYTNLYHRLYAPHDMLLVYGHRRGVELKIKMDTRKDKYNISGLISSDEGFDKIVREIPKYDAVILNDVPAPLRNDLLKFCYRYRVRTYVSPKLTDIMLRGAEYHPVRYPPAAGQGHRPDSGGTGGQADHGHPAQCHRAADSLPPHAAHRGGDQAGGWRTGVLPAEASDPERPGI